MSGSCRFVRLQTRHKRAKRPLRAICGDCGSHVFSFLRDRLRVRAMQQTQAGCKLFEEVPAWYPAMLEQLSDQIRECYERAAEAKAGAEATNDLTLKVEFLKVEGSWLTLARSYGFTERLEDFTTENSERRRKFDYFLRANMGSACGASGSECAEQIIWSIVESSNDSIITVNLDGIISSWNKAAERLFGYTAEEVIGRRVAILIPPERHDEEPTILARIRRGERIQHYETVRQRKNGGLIDISLTVSPIKSAQGKVVGAAKIARDITERRRDDERIATLAREAEHRTKNILATVQATVNLSHSDTADGLKRAIEGRIRALAKLHDLFVKSCWTGAELSSIVDQELAPYVGDGLARAPRNGPYVFLPPKAAQAIAVTLHELATNAVKYGSLSVPKGQVEVMWAIATDGRLILYWTESGGPLAKKPTREGFGTSVIERMIREQLNGELHLDWRPEGLVCKISLRT
jgi:PAS domain S-box-containing protein